MLMPECLPVAEPGYVSGWLSSALPAVCTGLTSRACATCQALPSATAVASCIACAKAAAPASTTIIYNGIAATTRAETCASCFGTNATDSAT